MSESLPQPLIHIGYHKTGTTWLQGRLFGKPAHGFLMADRRTVNARLVMPNSLDFDAEAAREGYLPFLCEAGQKGLVPVLSQERLCGSFDHGGYDSKEVATRLRAVFPDARILIVIREQRRMILSSYKEYSRKGGVMSLGRWLHPRKRVRSTPVFSLAHFEYDRLIRCYRDLFGAERVLVLPYELLASRPAEFLSSIVGFSGTRLPDGLNFTRSRESLSGPVLAVKRWFNLLFMAGPRNPGCIIPVGENVVFKHLFSILDWLVPGFIRRWSDRRMLSAVASAAGDCYRESNRRTAEMTGLDLGGCGYMMP